MYKKVKDLPLTTRIRRLGPMPLKILNALLETGEPMTAKETIEYIKKHG